MTNRSVWRPFATQLGGDLRLALAAAVTQVLALRAHVRAWGNASWRRDRCTR